MKNLAVITARSGSKGLIDKNIRLLNGHPLMSYTIRAAIESGMFEHVFVSTDSEDYANIAREYGAEVPFLRNQSLAGDEARSIDVVYSSVVEYERQGKFFDTVTLLQPTSPLRSPEDIIQAYDIFSQKRADSVVSVCEVSHSPLLCNTLSDEGSLLGFVDERNIGRRQDYRKFYRINGAIYIMRTTLLKDHSSLYGEKSYAFIMSKEHSIDIDDAFDFFLAERYMDYGVGDMYDCDIGGKV